jgi:phosphoesterase RecJ-like protein
MAAQESKPVSYARLASHVLGDVVVSEGFTIAYIGQWLIQECRSSTAEASSMIDLIRNIGGRDGSILLVEDIANEDGTTVRIRFRSHNKPIDELAKQFGGGGHPMASGAKVKGHLLDVYDEVFKAAKEYFKEVA